MLTEVIILSIILLLLIKPTIKAIISLKETISGWVDDYREYKEKKRKEKLFNDIKNLSDEENKK